MKALNTERALKTAELAENISANRSKQIVIAARRNLPKRRPYVPILSAVERQAYAAAHRILTVDTENMRLLCPGARRSATVDAIAKIIMEQFA